MGEEIAAFVTGTAETAALMAYCAERLAPYKRPKAVFSLETLPKSELGKVQKTALVRLLPKN